MRSLFGLLTALVLVAHAGCGSDSSSVAEPTTGGSGGSHSGGTAGVSGGSGGTGASWPTGGADGGGAAGSGASGGTSGSGGVAGVAGTGATGAVGGAAGSSTGGCGNAPSVQCGTGGACEFPQGVPDNDFFAAACTYQDTDPAVDSAVNAAMASLTGCGVGSDCPITVVAGTTVDEICQNWFAAVTAQLRSQGFCAGQHAVGSTDEIAVSNTCCEGKWYGYHICNYGGGKVVWNPGARRGWWMITPNHC